MTSVPSPSWVDPPEFDDPRRVDIYNAIHHARHEFEEVPFDQKRSPVYEKWRDTLDDPTEDFIVNSPAAINDGYCKIFAERVHELLGHPADVELQSRGVTHTWLAYDGRHYDAQTPCGVPHPSQLPVFG